MSLEHVRLSNEARNRLITLKRRTGLTQWNEISRWALCRSLAESTPPGEVAGDGDADGGIDMTWKVFAGTYGDVYLALLEHRCQLDGLPTDDETLAQQLRLHLHRGIGYLFGDRATKNVLGLVSLPLTRSDADAATG